MTLFTMPSLGADMEEGRLVEWLVAIGDKVNRGDVVAVVETQKGAIEVEIFDTGEVVELIAKIGQTLPVGAPLARITKPGEAGEGEAEHVSKALPAFGLEEKVPFQPAAASSVPAPISAGGGAVLASPAARARAAEAGIAIGGIAGSGPGGAVLFADVERQIREKPAAAIENSGGGERQRQAGARHGRDAPRHIRGYVAGQAGNPALLPVA